MSPTCHQVMKKIRTKESISSKLFLKENHPQLSRSWPENTSFFSISGWRVHCSDPWDLLHGLDARCRASQGQDDEQMGRTEMTRNVIKINWLQNRNKLILYTICWSQYVLDPRYCPRKIPHEDEVLTFVFQLQAKSTLECFQTIFIYW